MSLYPMKQTFKIWRQRIFLSLLLLPLIFFLSAENIFAQYYKLELADPAATLTCGQNFLVKLFINTNNVKTIAGDALIKYDNLKLNVDLTRTSNGNFFTYFSANPLGGSSDKLLISSWEESVAHEKSSTTDTLFANLSFSPKAPGSATFSFDCVGTTGADSNINKSSDFSDIIVCGSNKPLTVTIGGTSCVLSPTPTVGPTSTPSATLKPVPTSTPSATPTKKPTSTPIPTKTPVPTIIQAGTTGVTFVVLGLGIILTIIGILFIV